MARCLTNERRCGVTARSTASVGGVLLLGLGVAGLYWMYPEIVRYLKIKRM